MKILKTQVLRGPNVWSNYRKNLIQVRLDLEEMENFPTDKIPGFNEKLKALLPGLIEHECSEGVRGGFYERLRRGTWLGHVMEHVALELQTVAGIEAGFGRTRGTSTKGVYNVVFAFIEENAGLYAAQAAFRLVEALSKGLDYDLAEDIEELQYLYRRNGLGPSTKSIVDEAVSRGIPWKRTGNNSTIRLGQGINQMLFQATMTARTGAMAVDLASNKQKTKQVLEKNRIPVASGGSCSSEEGLIEIIDEIGFPIVIKPLDANQGKGISIDVRDLQGAKTALAAAQQYGRRILVEKYAEGFDYRIVVIGHKFAAASKRIPANVTGDGKSTIAALVEETNKDPRRGEGHEKSLTKITINEETQRLLSRLNYTPQSVPAAGEIVYLKATANLSTGGSAIDVTDEVHPENKYLAERISRAIGLDICGIDLVSEDLSVPMRDNGAVVLEVNAAPGFRMHLAPSEGQPRNVAAAVIDMLYPAGKESRIPVIAVTGTNGKTTTTRLIAHIARTRGFNTGYTTTDGIYIGDHLIEEGDTTGPISGEIILNDPTVEFAVLETARGGIIRSGLCFDNCDVGIITNIREDHLGLNDINTLDDLANVKGVVARSVHKNGHAVLNADDAQCVKISDTLDGKVAYFSMNPSNEILQQHIAEGKPAALYENENLYIIRNSEKQLIDAAKNLPLTRDGKCSYMISNILAASLAANLWGFSLEEIREALRSFSSEQTPGRLNTFDFNKFRVLVDYAHNPDGYQAIEEYLKQVEARKKIGIISGIGDRRDEDITACAEIACRMFDHIIIRQEHSLRGSNEERINGLIIKSIENSPRSITYEIVPEEVEAIKKAIHIAGEGDLVVALSDLYKDVIAAIMHEKENLVNA